MLLASTEVFQRGEVKNQTIPEEVEFAAREYLKVKPHMQYHHIDLKKLTRDNQVKGLACNFWSDIQILYSNYCIPCLGYGWGLCIFLL